VIVFFEYGKRAKRRRSAERAPCANSGIFSKNDLALSRDCPSVFQFDQQHGQDTFYQCCSCCSFGMSHTSTKRERVSTSGRCGKDLSSIVVDSSRRFRTFSEGIYRHCSGLGTGPSAKINVTFESDPISTTWCLGDLIKRILSLQEPEALDSFSQMAVDAKGQTSGDGTTSLLDDTRPRVYTWEKTLGQERQSEHVRP
jgi:hypothetical protein